MTFSCRRASDLISLSHDRRLSLHERVSLGFHLCVCGMCREAAKQMRFVESLGGMPIEKLEHVASRRALPEATRERLRREIARRTGAGSDAG